MSPMTVSNDSQHWSMQLLLTVYDRKIMKLNAPTDTASAPSPYGGMASARWMAYKSAVMADECHFDVTKVSIVRAAFDLEAGEGIFAPRCGSICPRHCRNVFIAQIRMLNVLRRLKMYVYRSSARYRVPARF